MDQHEICEEGEIVFQDVIKVFIVAKCDDLLDRAVETQASVKSADGLWLFGRRGQRTEARNQC